MTKEDKLFFTGLIKGLETTVGENSRSIRHNGMLIELMRDDITLIREADSFQLERSARIDAIFESMGLELPAIKQAVSNNSKRITVLEAKHG